MKVVRTIAIEPLLAQSLPRFNYIDELKILQYPSGKQKSGLKIQAAFDVDWVIYSLFAKGSTASRRGLGDKPRVQGFKSSVPRQARGTSFTKEE